jgi:hypothetical protein
MLVAVTPGVLPLPPLLFDEPQLATTRAPATATAMAASLFLDLAISALLLEWRLLVPGALPPVTTLLHRPPFLGRPDFDTFSLRRLKD